MEQIERQITDEEALNRIYAEVNGKEQDPETVLRIVETLIETGRPMYDPDDGPFCSECGKPCQGEARDFGIGSYEYWGATGVDTNWQYVSTCCEGDVCKSPDGTGRVEPDPYEAYDPYYP